MKIKSSFGPPPRLLFFKILRTDPPPRPRAFGVIRTTRQKCLVYRFLLPGFSGRSRTQIAGHPVRPKEIMRPPMVKVSGSCPESRQSATLSRTQIAGHPVRPKEIMRPPMVKVSGSCPESRQSATLSRTQIAGQCIAATRVPAHRCILVAFFVSAEASD